MCTGYGFLTTIARSCKWQEHLGTSVKDYGLISTPQLSSWKLTEKDEFVILATDGGGEDGFLGEDPVRKPRSCWCTAPSGRGRRGTQPPDDCAVVCIFLNHPCLSSALSSDGCGRRGPARGAILGELKSARSGAARSLGSKGRGRGVDSARGVSRGEFPVRMPRFAGVLGWRR
ncbi:hypothetical protein HPP92_019194 [Vanilla planifolia]|uniref:protein-serine/threonine phosphatase n=1 Tax=Vanilla planifolia TaxID=51239 RepID=A0A835Q6C3_VANPL|nr:hypothetical protein HPP92_019703 [Vanilla planifolia]KAG0465030.1 hypothetical protein HPP92_019194 [Vanilla planifolia]